MKLTLKRDNKVLEVAEEGGPEVLALAVWTHLYEEDTLVIEGDFPTIQVSPGCGDLRIIQEGQPDICEDTVDAAAWCVVALAYSELERR